MKHILAAAFLTVALAGPAFAESGVPVPGDVNAMSQGPTDYYTAGYDRGYGTRVYGSRAQVLTTHRLGPRHTRIIHRHPLKY